MSTWGQTGNLSALTTLLSMIRTQVSDLPNLDREVRTELIGGMRAHHTSAEEKTDLMLRSTQTLNSSPKNQCECRTRRWSYVSTQGLPHRGLITLRDQSPLPSFHELSLYSPWPDNIAEFVHFLFRLLLFHCELSGKSNG